MKRVMKSSLVVFFALFVALASRAQGGSANGSAIGGSGKTNYIPIWTSSTNLGSSVVFQHGSGASALVGIGTTAPAATLDVNGMVRSATGGFEFPDGSVQVSAGLTKVSHNATLAGAGTSKSPLAIKVPLSLTSSGSSFTLQGINSFASGGAAGVYGQDNSGSNVGIGTYGLTGIGYGVRGDATSTAGFAVAGIASASGGISIYGEADAPATTAGYFKGNVNVTGTLTKGGGSFKIDHPLDPANKYLYHSFVESPDMKNIYDGTVVTDGSGFASVTLPDWFEALNRDFRYQLTVIGQFAQAIVASEVSQNQFTIRTDHPNVKVSWQVTGIRQDAWANANRIPVEVEKPDAERGYYLHPGLYGAPESKNVLAVEFPGKYKEGASH